ncbi:MAG: SLC26A/SulP transporter family protein [Rhodocyclaceae bacterium]|nr:SLC26A/SulP transporter family protein [Rhodocyclaceae bacterium]MBP7079992.1 SLC26A/SulP transporter family protein [Rhodocyclaceae bacterium]
MKLFKLDHLMSDLWGGFAAMLVALPASVAYGVAIFSAVGPNQAGFGALAGIIGAAALGLIAPAFGGTRRLITAPCAPAAAVLSAFAISAIHDGISVTTTLLMLSLLGLLAGSMQILFGLLRLGRLIKYMPYPVVSGYLSGVGLIVIGSQLPKFLGVTGGLSVWSALGSYDLWRWQGITVGIVTIAVMLITPKITKSVPGAILGLAAGIATYHGLALTDSTLLALKGNPFVIGVIGNGGSGDFLGSLNMRWNAVADLSWHQFKYVAVPALTLAVLLSIDTLKTCLVLDALTRSRHDSDRELIGQGLGNLAAGFAGGVSGAGTMSATLVNISAGGNSRFSGTVEGVLVLTAFLLLAEYISWIPVAALAGILLVIGSRMIDLNSLQFLKSRQTILDFAVIAAVVITALTVSLIAASGTGILLAIGLFLREQIGGSVVHRKLLGNELSSKRVRTREEMGILTAHGDRAVVFELQGSLFFGTANQLYLNIEPELKKRDFVILDMRRIQTVDVTAAHLLEQLKDVLADKNGTLIFSQIPQNLPSGRDVQEYFDRVGLIRRNNPVKVFDALDDALEWVEDRIIEDTAFDHEDESLLELNELDLFSGRKEATLAALEVCMEKRTFVSGQKIFARGDRGDELYLIRRGAVRILLPLADKRFHHIGTFGRGAFFGEMGFLDGEVRSADAVAFSDTDLYVLSRKAFDSLAEQHKKLGLRLMEGLASVLAGRLRYSNAELRALES